MLYRKPVRTVVVPTRETFVSRTYENGASENGEFLQMVENLPALLRGLRKPETGIENPVMHTCGLSPLREFLEIIHKRTHDS